MQLSASAWFGGARVHRRQLLAAAGVALIVAPAGAYRTTREVLQLDQVEEVAWRNRQISFDLFEEPVAVPQEAEFGSAVVEAMALWNQNECAALELQVSSSGTGRAVPLDGRNTIELVHSGWDELGFAAESGANADVQLAKVDGAWVIDEADIYVDATKTVWDSTTHAWLVSVLGHELGHAIGLEHPCEEAGAAAVVCDESFETAIMHPVYSASRSAPNADEMAGVCALYPRLSGDPGTGGSGAAVLCESDDCGVGGAAGNGTQPSATDDPALVAFGDACERGADCETGQCLDVDGTGMCTRACSNDSWDPATCPIGWYCADVGEGHPVCAPKAEPSDGCACSQPVGFGRAPLAMSIWSLALLGLTIVNRRRG